MIAFGAGYRLASRTRLKPAVVSASGVPPTDFAIPLPEGSTRITITDPQVENWELTTFTVTREGNSFKGIPELERTIQPRSHLSLDDSAFFRRELAGIAQIPKRRGRALTGSATGFSRAVTKWLCRVLPRASA
jgi:hypothetical protein